MKLFCVLVAVACFSSIASTSEDSHSLETPAESRSRFAMLDDVRLLANGLLQLGQSLREFVHKTKGQINDIFQKLNIFDRSFSQLSAVTNVIKEEEEELKKTTTFLKANNEEIKNLSQEINSKVNNILHERGQLQTKVGGLEEKLTGMSKSTIPPEQLVELKALKEIIEAQEKNIQSLLKAVKEQHDQLNYQSRKIKNLEEKLTYDTFQETTEKLEQSNSKTPYSLQYLTTNTSINTTDLPSDCSEVFNSGERKSGVFAVKPNQSEPFYVYCDITADGGATVIQRRQDGAVDFDQTWEKYETGFGDLESEFWLGLEKIHAIARQGTSILHLQLEDWKGEKLSAEYQFSLEGPASQYTIHLQQASGSLAYAMANHTGMRFSTKDRDNDNNEDLNCARHYGGGWWFNSCRDTNLNGRYVRARPRGRPERRSSIAWRPERGHSHTLRATSISVRHTSYDRGFR